MTPAERRESCAAQHFGPWACEARWLAQAVAAVRAGTWAPQQPQKSPDEERGYILGGRNHDVAIVPIHGQITKGRSSFGGASSVAIRRAIRQAADDSAVRSILLFTSSPGGSVYGTGDAADDVARVSAAKPVYAFCEDLAASAAFWIIAGCRKVFASENARVGAIGTYTLLEDSGGLQDASGVKLTVISSAPLKGAGADGRVTPELVSEVQREINDLNSLFLAAIQRGRKLSEAAVAAVATGQVWLAKEAKRLGLVDVVCTLDECLDYITTGIIPSSAVPAPQLPDVPEEAPELPDETALAKMTDNELYDAWKAAAGNEAAQKKFAAVRATRAGTDTGTVCIVWKYVSRTESTPEEVPFVTPAAKAETPTGVKPMIPTSTKLDAVAAKAQAATEWDANLNDCRSAFVSKQIYQAYRSAVLSGRFKEKAARTAGGSTTEVVKIGSKQYRRNSYGSGRAVKWEPLPNE